MLDQTLSSTKYQIELASGSTIASVKAIIKETSAISIKHIIAIDTYNFEEMIFQEITFLRFFGIGVIYSGKEGEHFTVTTKFGPIQLEFTLRIWKGII